MLETAQHERTRLRSYLPRLLLEWIAESPGATHREVEGSVAFVDISGFTKLSERLAKRGKVGAEELTDAIGTCFTRLLAVAYGNGGSLLKFGGDALLLLFRGEGNQAKAARAAVGMRRALKEIGGLDCGGLRVVLRMSVGIHSGAFHFFLVGDSHRELVITGPAATQTVVMESTAEAGEIVVSPATAAALSDGLIGGAKGPGFLLRRQPPGLSREPGDPDTGEGDLGLLSFIPAAVRERVLAGLEEPEHKRVTVAFVHFDGTDELIERDGPSAAAQFLDTLVRDVQAAVDRRGICFLGTDVDRDGGKIILSAGAPVASGNDEERMLLALREIVEVERTLPVRVGVNRGHVFAGEIGPSYRRTYTVMGDAVNLAARLMAKASAGQILATDGVLEHSRTQFQTTALEPFMVKGKAQPVQAYSLGEIAGSKKDEMDAARLPLIGREHEMEALLGALGAARRGQGQMVEIIGEPGIGKSRLVEELRANGQGIRVFTVTCELYESSTPYLPFRRLLRAALGISQTADEEAAGERLLQFVAESAPELLPWTPLIAIPLDASVPPTEEASQLSEEFRRPRLEQATRDLLFKLLSEPTLVTIEDAHWMDEASADLLRDITRDLASTSWLVCVTRRDVETGFTPSGDTPVLSLRPEPLDQSAAAALVDAATEESPLAPHEITALAKRSGGNPLFLKELLAAAQAAGGLEDLPDSVEAVITARIDRLAPIERALLRHLSVLGLTFPRTLAESALPDEFPSEDHQAWQRLGEFVQLDQSGLVRFSHALIRDAAYDGLPFRLRQNLHARVGETIEREAGDSAEDQAELLSLHFFHARRFEPAWRYSRMAAERARAMYANVEAAEFCERALEAARRGSAAVPSTELAGVYETLGDIRMRIGEFTSASRAYGRARRLIRDNPVQAARLLLSQAWVSAAVGRYPDALRWVRRANRALEGAEGIEISRQRAHVAAAFAGIYRAQGRPADVIKWCKHAICEAELADEKAALAHACYLLDTAYIELGQWDEATYSRRALAIFEELNNLGGQANVLINLGAHAYWGGRWDEALDLFERGRLAREKIGDAVNAADGAMNVGEIRADQGKLDEAEPVFRKVLRVWKASGERLGVAWATSNLGRLAARRGRFEEAILLLEQARREFEDLGAKADLLETEARIAESLVLQGNAPKALAVADEILRRIKTMSGVGRQTAMLQRARGQALLLLRDFQAARIALEQGLEAARSSRLDYEIALTLKAIARLTEAEGAASRDLDSESRAILDRLGVMWIPEPPSCVNEVVPERVAIAPK